MKKTRKIVLGETRK